MSRPLSPMTAFRVHFVDGEAMRVVAPTPADARKLAESRRPGLLITKIKKIKGEVDVTENSEVMADG